MRTAQVEQATRVYARIRALAIVRARYRDAGRKLPAKARDLEAEAMQLLAQHPELMMEARLRVAQFLIKEKFRKARK